jgi:hypothetical protein
MSQTVFTLPNGTPLAAGNFTSPNFNFPAGINSVTVQFNVSAADLIDPTKQITFGLWRFDGTNFLFDSGFVWWGNSLDDNGQPSQPGITVAVGPLAGKQCQVLLSLPKAISSGVTVTSN